MANSYSCKFEEKISFPNIDKKLIYIYIYIYKRINHLIYSKNKHIYKHIYCTLLISYYLFLYIYIYHNTLVAHNMNLLYNLKVKYLFIFII